MALTGLTSSEVDERARRGEVNSAEEAVSRSYSDIVVKNVCTPFNLILFALGAVLLLLDEPLNALAATGVIAMNILVATVQEVRAKRRLDRIALLLRPKVTVLRDGAESVIDQAGIVKDDVVVLRPGEQALVDGELLESEYLEMDESLLSGESRTVRKRAGDPVYSGSYCVTGEGAFRVTAFGDETFASKMLASARRFTNKSTPLQMETAAITKLLMTIAFVYMAVMVAFSLLRHGAVDEAFREVVNAAVIIMDIVPIALFLLIVIAYMVAAVRMADSGVLLQRSSAVESISHVDTVCMDKTGTITTNRLEFDRMDAFAGEAEAEGLLRAFIGATGSRNRTVDALEGRFGRAGADAADEIRFSSERKFSAVKLDLPEGRAALFLGALSALGPHLDRDVSGKVAELSAQGLRTVVFAKAGDVPLYDGDEPRVPDLEAVAVIAIRDEVRRDCRETIGVFMDNGMDVKVISGDDPATVDSLFTVARIPGERKIMSGEELDALEGEERDRAILETNIFGRMKPDHKELIVDTLKRHGRYVAMVGDGVNDVKSLKRAQVGVALQSGSGAARGVADMVLMNDNFAALPRSLVEGRRTVSGMRDILKLYISRNFVLALVIALVFLFFREAAFLPTEVSFYAIASVSIAAFLMTIWAVPTAQKGAVLPKVLRYAVPMAVLIASFGFAVYVAMHFAALADPGWWKGWYGDDLLWLAQPSYGTVEEMLAECDVDARLAEVTARNGMLLFVTLAGITQLLLITPCCRFFSLDGEVRRDPKPALLVLLLYGFVYMIYNLEGTVSGAHVTTARIANLATLPPGCVAAVLVAVAVWFLVSRAVLRKGIFGFLTTFTERWYSEKLERAYSEEE